MGFLSAGVGSAAGQRCAGIDDCSPRLRILFEVLQRTQAFRSYLSSTWYERVGSARASLRLVAIGFGDANLALRAAASNYRRDEVRTP